MWNDPIVEELHKVRSANAEKFHYDLRAIYNALKVHEKKNRRRVVSLPIKRHEARQEMTTAKAKTLRKIIDPTVARPAHA